MKTRTLITSLLAASLAAAPARAEILTYDGDVLVDRALPGEQNFVFPDYADGVVVLDGTGVDATGEAVDACTAYDYGGPKYACPLRAGGLRVELGDGADTAGFDYVGEPWPAGTTLVVDGGAGDDDLQGGIKAGTSAPVTLIGGDGKDTLKGSNAADVLDGGSGNDDLDARGGADEVRGGAGDDVLAGDGYYADPAADRIDGGDGTDRIEFEWRRADDAPAVAVTLGDGADDGRPGEGDDVRGVELVKVARGTVIGDDGPNSLWHSEFAGPARLDGRGGDDDLLGSDDSGDTLVGGAGADDLAGYGGDDTLIGGPGADRIDADGSSGCVLGPVYGGCTFRAGNDTIDAADGEADSVTCGPGADTVRADAQDTVSEDCETVTRAAALPEVSPATPGCAVPRVVGRRPAKARRMVIRAGCKVRLRGHGRRVRRQSVKAGQAVAAGTVVVLRRGR